MTRKKYMKEFKAEAVRLSERRERTIAQVAADVDLKCGLLGPATTNTITFDIVLL